jgi:Mg-chelatase subunit ChlD
MLLPMNTPLWPAAQFHRPAPAPHTAPDQIALVGFATRAHILATPAPAAAATILDAIRNKLTNSSNGIGGSTNIAAGLRLANGLLLKAPCGFRKRVWLLSDGQPNEEENEIFPQVNALRASWTNLNTIAFGYDADEDLLRRMAAATHNGHFFKVSDVATLSAAFAGVRQRQNSIASKPEMTVYVIDQSGSMGDHCGLQRKIDVVAEALANLVHQKKQLYS